MEVIWKFIGWSGLWKLKYKMTVLSFGKLDIWNGLQLWKYMNNDTKRDVLNSLPKDKLYFYWNSSFLETEECIILWKSINQYTRIALWNVLYNGQRMKIWEKINTFEERMEVWRNLTKEQRVKWLYIISHDYSEFVNNIELDDLVNWWRDIKNHWNYRDLYNSIWINCLNWDNRIKLWKALNLEERIFLWDCLTGIKFKPFDDWTYRFELLEHLEWEEFVGLWKHITWNDCAPLCHRTILWKRMNWIERINLWKRLGGDEKYDLFTHLKSDMQNELVEYISEEDKKEIEQRRIALWELCQTRYNLCD